MEKQKLILELDKAGKKGPMKLLSEVIDRFSLNVKLASSLGAEDQVLTHMLVNLDDKCQIFLLDTGRLHQETYDLMSRTMTKFSFNYEVFFPETAAVEKMVSREGPNLFYKNVSLRKQCCQVRKIEPLQRALKKTEGWITGLRREQSFERSKVSYAEWDHEHGIIKINPLAEWSDTEVWRYLRDNDVPYNALHDKGYPRIGCAPCTRAIEEKESPRAGRWWWEDGAAKECGLHREKNQELI